MPTLVQESVPQRLRYGGYWYDPELGWYWVSVRHYSPSLRRWLAPDPSQQDGVRTYVYVGDDPVDRSDPSGLDPVGSSDQGAGTNTLAPTPIHFNFTQPVVVASCESPQAPVSIAFVAASSTPICGQTLPGFGSVTEDLPPTGYIDPFLVRFTQNNINWLFKDRATGKLTGTLGKTIEQLRNGSITADDIPPIRLVLRDGYLWSLDNRRLWIFRYLRLPIRYEIVNFVPSIAKVWSQHFTTNNDGESVVVRNEPQDYNFYDSFPDDLIID